MSHDFCVCVTARTRMMNKHGACRRLFDFPRKGRRGRLGVAISSAWYGVVFVHAQISHWRRRDGYGWRSILSARSYGAQLLSGGTIRLGPKYLLGDTPHGVTIVCVMASRRSGPQVHRANARATLPTTIVTITSEPRATAPSWRRRSEA